MRHKTQSDKDMEEALTKGTHHAKMILNHLLKWKLQANQVKAHSSIANSLQPSRGLPFFLMYFQNN